MYILNNKEYRTKTQINDYFKNKKDQYDSGTLLKNTDKDFFDDVIALFQNHDEVESKLKNMIDILIKHNDKKQNAFFIVKPNNELTSISYIHCIKCINKPLKEIKISVQKSNLNQAMRYAIEPQIKTYTKNNPINANSFNNYGLRMTQDLLCLIIFVFRSNLVKSEGFVHFTREYITSQ